MTFFLMVCMVLLLQTSFPDPTNADLVDGKSIEPARRHTRGCPMSPYAMFLTEEQQKTLHELVVEARHEGADEGTVKEHINKYISKILPAKKYAEFQDAFEAFEANRRRLDKRNTETKKVPQKVYDLLDRYSGNIPTNYAQFYKDNIRN